MFSISLFGQRILHWDRMAHVSLLRSPYRTSKASKYYGWCSPLAVEGSKAKVVSSLIIIPRVRLDIQLWLKPLSVAIPCVVLVKVLRNAMRRHTWKRYILGMQVGNKIIQDWHSGRLVESASCLVFVQSVYCGIVVDNVSRAGFGEYSRNEFECNSESCQ